MRDYTTETARGNALGYFALFIALGLIGTCTSGCTNWRVRGEVAVEEIDEHTEHVTIRKSEPWLCRFYSFADCPKAGQVEGS